MISLRFQFRSTEANALTRKPFEDTDYYFDEIRKYSQYSQSEAWMRRYSRILPIKAKRTVTLLKQYKGVDCLVLDVGCSTALTLWLIAKEFKNSIGVEPELRAAEIAVTRLRDHNLPNVILRADGGALPFANGTFDIVTNIEVIEHVQHPRILLGEIARVLKPDGILHITTANKLWPIEPHYRLPFLSYLPNRWASAYVRIMKRGHGYDGIRLPTYWQFRSLVEEFFDVEDVTLGCIADYRRFELHKERGFLIQAVAPVVRTVLWGEQALASLGPYNPFRWLSKLLTGISLGWLFIAKPRQEYGNICRTSRI